MNHIHKRRFYLIGLFALGLGLAASLILYALRQNLNLFVTPSDLAAIVSVADHSVRLGGMVKTGSVKRDTAGLGVQFQVTDFKHAVTVRYIGVLPDLFREGKGVVVDGRFNTQHVFVATQVLAKHDENYMPKKVYRAMREQAA